MEGPIKVRKPKSRPHKYAHMSDEEYAIFLKENKQRSKNAYYDLHRAEINEKRNAQRREERRMRREAKKLSLMAT